MPKKSDKNFEEKLEELEKIAMQIEDGKLSLEDSISKFEEGIKLSKECTKILDDAEKKINILLENEEGDMVESKFEEEV